MSDHDVSSKTEAAELPIPARQRLGFRRLLRLCRKELREVVRDRRTIFTLVLMPLLAYPLISMSFHRLIFSSRQHTTECLAGIARDDDLNWLYRYLGRGQRILDFQNQAAKQEPDEAGPRPDDPAVFGANTPGDPLVRFLIIDNLTEAVRDGRIDVGIRIKPDDNGPTIRGLRAIRLDFITREGSAIGEAGAEFMAQRLEAINDRYTRGILARVGANPQLPVEIEVESVKGEGSTMSLTAFVPLILILMTITGAVYPAIDLTAGERERGTLETLMAAPVPRFGLLFAKYVAVVTIAMLTATTNLAAMTVTLLVTGMGDVVFGPEGPTIALMDQVFLLLMLFAGFFSAILLAITSFARSFKEAQSYLIPLMLVTLAPGIMSLMPNLEFTGPLAVVPLVNIVLLARDLLEGTVDPRLAVAAVLSTLLYAIAAISLAARIFGTDAILYGSEATWSDLARRPDRVSDVPTVAGAMICLACLYPCYFLVANSLQRITNAAMSTRLLLTAGVTVLLFVGLPILAAVFQRARLTSTFQLRRFGVLTLLGAILLGLSLWPFAHEAFMLNELLGIKSLDAKTIESAQSLIESWNAISPWIILLSFAIAPAFCEEFFFRGYLMGSLRKALPGSAAIIISAVLFGVFHVITTSVLATERLVPSTFLGLFLGWVCLKTGSVFPGMILHGLHNGFLLMVVKYRDQLAELGIGIQDGSHMPSSWLGAAAVGVVIGVGLIAWGNRGRKAKVVKTSTFPAT